MCCREKMRKTMAARATARRGSATLRATMVVRGKELFVAVWLEEEVGENIVGLVCVEKVEWMVADVIRPGSFTVMGAALTCQ